MRTLHLGSSSRISREFSVDAMRLVLEMYTPELDPERLQYVVEALGAIHGVYMTVEAGELADAAKQANKPRRR